MKNLFIALVCLFGFLVLVTPTGCYYDNEEDLYGPDTTSCDTAGMRYSVEIKKILADNCNSCHVSTSSTYSFIPYESYEQLREVALNGKLVERINSLSDPMPETGLMDKCSRQKIEAWVNAGAPNN